jgi:predicted porin
MNKKLMAVAVAGALAPGLALAQSTVTISGFIKADAGQISINNASGVRTGLNTSTMAFSDGGPSRIRFTMREDLGGGLYGLGQLEIRPTINGRGTGSNGLANSNTVNMGFGSSSGNQWVGLESTQWGTVRVGSVDQYYLEGAGYAGIYGPIDTVPQFLGYTNVDQPGVVQYGIGYQTRTRNVVHYDTPNWNGFTGQAGYAFGSGASGGSADLATGATKVESIYFSLRYAASNWNVGWNHLIDKPSLGGAAPVATPTPITLIGIENGISMTPGLNIITGKLDAVGDRLFGEWLPGGGFGVQLGVEHTKLTTASGVNVTAPGVVGANTIANKTAWILSGKYETGPHYMWVSYGQVGDTGGATTTVNGSDGAHQWNLGYAYLFSKRTSIGVGWTKIWNKSSSCPAATAALLPAGSTCGGYYSLSNEEAALNDTSGSGYNVNSSMSRPGEQPSYFGVSMRHVF